MKRNGNAERRRRENRGAEGSEGVGSGEGVSPSPVGKGLGRGRVFSSENALICLTMVHFGAFGALYFIYMFLADR